MKLILFIERFFNDFFLIFYIFNLKGKVKKDINLQF